MPKVSAPASQEKPVSKLDIMSQVADLIIEGKNQKNFCIHLKSGEKRRAAGIDHVPGSVLGDILRDKSFKINYGDIQKIVVINGSNPRRSLGKNIENQPDETDTQLAKIAEGDESSPDDLQE
jgi:hypothetical protein